MKIRRKPQQPILDGIGREKSLPIEFGGIFEAPNLSSFSTKSAERYHRRRVAKPIIFTPRSSPAPKARQLGLHSLWHTPKAR